MEKYTETQYVQGALYHPAIANRLSCLISFQLLSIFVVLFVALAYAEPEAEASPWRRRGGSSYGRYRGGGSRYGGGSRRWRRSADPEPVAEADPEPIAEADPEPSYYGSYRRSFGGYGGGSGYYGGGRSSYRWKRSADPEPVAEADAEPEASRYNSRRGFSSYRGFGGYSGRNRGYGGRYSSYY